MLKESPSFNLGLPTRSLYLVALHLCLCLFSLPPNQAFTQTCVQPPVGLVAWWPGDGNALDIVGPNNGAMVNAASFAPGLIGQAFSLDGTDDIVDLGVNNIIGSGNAPFTVAAWMFPTRIPTGSYYFLIRLKQDAQFFVAFGQDFLMSGGSVGAIFRGEAHQWLTPIDHSSLVNQWTHVAVIYNGGDKSAATSFAIFFNGVKLPTGSVDLGVVGGNCNDNVLGSDTRSSCVGNFELFQGLIDEVQIYNRVLSGSEIQTLSDAGSTGTCKPAAQTCVSQVTATYDLAADWSDVSNPNGVWSYNEISNPLPLQSPWEPGFGSAWAYAPWPNFGHVPFWAKTQVSSSVDGFEIGDVIGHSSDSGRGENYGPANVAWTSPSAGNITVSGSAWISPSIDRSNRWELYLNGTLLSSGDMLAHGGYYRSTPFDFSTGSGGAAILTNIPVSAGDVVKLQIVKLSTYGHLVGVSLRITLCASPSAQTCVAPPPGMVAWWPGDGDARDLVGTNHGSIAGNVTFEQGLVGQAFRFDGMTGYIRVPHDASIAPANAITIDAWIKPTAPLGGVAAIVKKPGALDNSGYALEFWDVPDVCLWIHVAGRGWEGCYKGPAPLDQWTHVAGVFNGGCNTVYINGAPIRTYCPGGGITVGDGELWIGNDPSHPDRFYNGLIDEVEIFNRALSGDEIHAIYQAGSAGKCKEPVNQPPVAVCRNVTVSAGSGCTGTASIDNGSSDPDGDPITLSQSSPGPYSVGTTTVTLTVTDSKDASSSCTATVTVVDNTPPLVTAPPAVTVTTGVGAMACGTVVSDVTLGSASGSDNCPGALSISRGGVPAGNFFSVGTTTITYTAQDGSGNTAASTQAVTVIDDTQPTISCPANVTLTAAPGLCSAVASYTVTATDNCSIASLVSTPPSGSAFPIGTSTVTATAKDLAGNVRSCNFTVTVTNPDPVVTITGPVSGAVFAVGTAVNFSSTFTDVGGGTHTAQWMFDTAVDAGTVTEPTSPTPGSVSASHTFTAAGVYLVTLTVTDSCGGTGSANTVDGFTAMVVIYDPNGGFVTGGGWIDSPAGALVANPSLSGRANFGLVSKYQQGATVPTGETEFQFKVANLNFHSSSYEWLVIAGARAQYKGTGTINGTGDYGFLLTAIDGQVNGGGGVDKFRIKIWDRNNSGVIVYDNQIGASDNDTPSTALGSGSIVIHKQ